LDVAFHLFWLALAKLSLRLRSTSYWGNTSIDASLVCHSLFPFLSPLSFFLFWTQVLLFTLFSLSKFLDHLGEICANYGSYLSHVELDTLSELDTFFVYRHCGTPPSRGNTLISMDIKRMLGYLTGFQLDTLRFVFDLSAIIPDNIEKEN
jgi:hypothetical protein